MGIAILGGIFASLSSKERPSTTQERIPNRFVASVRRPQAAKRILDELSQYQQSKDLIIYEHDNVSAIKDADIILLCCAPHTPAEILQKEGVREALSGKILVHILAGVTNDDIRNLIYGEKIQSDSQCTIVKAMPNAAAAVRQSMTVIEESNPPLSEETNAQVTWIFDQVGKVLELPPSGMDIATVLGGSTPAMTALLIDAFAQGGIELGCPVRKSYEMAAQAMIGAATMILQGNHPGVIRDGTSCPGGCTAKALSVLEEGGVRGTLAKAIREGTYKASGLGKKD